MGLVPIVPPGLCVHLLPGLGRQGRSGTGQVGGLPVASLGAVEGKEPSSYLHGGHRKNEDQRAGPAIYSIATPGLNAALWDN